MQIQTTRIPAPARPLPTLSASSQALNPDKPQDQFSFSTGPRHSNRAAVAKVVLGVAAGVSLGAVSGLHTGTMAGVGGAVVTVLPGAFVGGVSGALLGERFGSQSKDTAGAGLWGAGLWGAALGGLAGGAAGAFVASNFAGWPAMITLGVAGGVTGLLVGGGN